MIRENINKEPKYIENPALTAMCGRRLQHILSEFGFAEVTGAAFTNADINAFHRSMPELPASRDLTTKQVLRALPSGKVLDIKTTADGATQWTVTFKCLHYVCTCQLHHQHEFWQFAGPPQVQPLPGTFKWLPSSWYVGPKYALAIDVAVVALLLVASFALGNAWARDAMESHTVEAAGAQTVKAEDAVHFVKEQGNLVMTPEQRDELMMAARNEAYEQAKQEFATTGSRSSQEKEGQDKNIDEKAKDVKEKTTDTEKTDAKKEDKKEKEQKKEKDSSFVFTMKEGMPVGELINALEERGYIKDKQAFIKRMEKQDLVTKVDIGKYKFTSGMSEDEVLEALK